MKHIQKSLITVFAILLVGCGGDSREELEKDLDIAQERVFTYELDVRPILRDRCIECHPSTDPISLVEFEDVKNLAERISNSIKGINGTVLMPLGGSRLEQFQIKTIEAWIQNGLIER